MRRYYRAGYSSPHPDVNMNPDHFPSRHWPIDIAWLTFPMACNAASLMDGLLLGQHVRHGSHSYPNNYYVYENTLS